ncbi:MAG TPA: VCBS repeat-containing protein, partial [Polyangium sp.]|nr:VCBS repeat-containing protein [Polyangium sp.]
MKNSSFRSISRKAPVWQTMGLLMGITIMTGCGSPNGGAGDGAGGFTGATRGDSVEANASSHETILAELSTTTTCTQPSDCPSGFCVDGVCCNNACTGLCRACSAAKKRGGVDGTCGYIAGGFDPDNECGDTCNGLGGCAKNSVVLGIGSACTANADCSSGFCVDGYCCDSACTGTCKACSATKKGSGSDGMCGDIAATTDPDNECASGDCNGSGACGTATGTNPNGAACSLGNTCLSGYCVDGVCCDFSCTGSCQACTAAKKGSGFDGVCGNIAATTDPDNECGFGSCNGTGGCETAIRLGNGTACSSAGQCSSGYCVDGVCCNDSCVGSCLACNVPTAMGTCTTQCASVCTGTLGFPEAPLTPLPILGNKFVSAASGDFNGDGQPDFVALDSGYKVASVFMNQGGGTFAPKVDYAAGTTPAVVAVDDLNRDGKPDLVTLETFECKVGVHLNQGNGTFAARVDYTTNCYSGSMSIADLNADGWSDFVISGSDVLMNQGNGTFVLRTNHGLVEWGAVSTGDVNGDGKPDVVTVNGRNMFVSYNNGDGTFMPATMYETTSYLAAATSAVADLNGDGKLDVVVF